MTPPEVPEQSRGAGGQDAAYACDLHLARCSPVCDALGGLPWSGPLLWFHDFGLQPLAAGRQLRIGVTAPSGAPAQIKALTATLLAGSTGVIAAQEFPLAPYVNRTRDAASAISLTEQGGRFSFVRGLAQAPLADADRRRLRTLCRAIEAWAALLSGGGLPDGMVPAAAHAHAQAGGGEDQDQLVVTEDFQEPTAAS